MQSINALEMRQSLGKALKKLERGGQPILVERAHKPSAVLISLDDFKKRFADYDAGRKRQEMVQKIKNLKLKFKGDESLVTTLRKLREAE